MRAVVTGGAGFLGSHLCERLLAEGYRVVCVDNLLTGRTDNIQHLLGRADFEFLKHDVSKSFEVDGQVDRVLHFASPASPIDYLELPIQTLKVGSLGTHNTLGLAKAKGARFLLASTSEVYGDPKEHPQTETLLGQRQSGGSARRLRRGEALRRGDDDGLPPHPWPGGPHRPDLQHLWSAHAPARRPRGARVPAAGSHRRADDRLR